MADIRFLCDKCGQKLRVDEEASGLKIACPGCGNMLVVPSPEESIPPPPPPVEPTAPQVPANSQPTTNVPPVTLAPAVVTATPTPQPVVASQPVSAPQPVVVAQPVPQPVAVPRVRAVSVSPEPVVVTAAPAPVQAAPAAPIPVQRAPVPIPAPPAVVAPQPPSAPSPKVKKPPTAAQLEAERRQKEALLSQRPAGTMAAQAQQSRAGKLGVEPIGAHLSRAELETAVKLSKNNGIIFWGVALAGVVVMFVAHMIFTHREMITGAMHVVLILVELTWTSIWGAMGMKHLNRAHVLESELKERKKKRRI